MTSPNNNASEHISAVSADAEICYEICGRPRDATIGDNAASMLMFFN